MLVINKKQKTCCSRDPRLRNERKREYRQILELSQRNKKKMAMEHEGNGVPIVIGVLGTVPKGLEERLEELQIRGRIKAIQITAILKSATIPRKNPET